jgi:hypothetical protein
MAENITGELKRCSDFFVTYYWTLPAIGLRFYTNITLITISFLSAFLGSFANVVVVLSYFKNSRLRTLSNIPLLSLAFSDLLVTSVVLPLHATRLVKETYGTHNCILWTVARLTSYFSAGVSLLTVTFISVERFITLAYPYRNQTILTRLRMKIIVANIWCSAFVVVVSHLWLIPYKAFLALCFTVVVVCIVTLLAIWIWVYKLLRNHKRRITTTHMPFQVTSKTENESRQQTHKNTRTSSIIVVGLILCYLPLIFMFAYYYTEPTNFMGIYIVTPWGEIFLLAHSLFNPLYVFWRKSEFRQTARILICRLRCFPRDMSNVIGNDNSITGTRKLAFVAQRC